MVLGRNLPNGAALHTSTGKECIVSIPGRNSRIVPAYAFLHDLCSGLAANCTPKSAGATAPTSGSTDRTIASMRRSEGRSSAWKILLSQPVGSQVLREFSLGRKGRCGVVRKPATWQPRRNSTGNSQAGRGKEDRLPPNFPHFGKGKAPTKPGSIFHRPGLDRPRHPLRQWTANSEVRRRVWGPIASLEISDLAADLVVSPIPAAAFSFTC
jgi:hypothetical protein